MTVSQKKLRVVFTAFVVGYVVFHLLTLTLLPLPWFDETYIASIALSWAEGGSFARSIALHDAPPEQELIYGPFYFVCVGLWFKLVGFSFFSYRFFVFISGIVVWLLTCLVYKTWDKDKLRNVIFAIFFALNPLFNRCLHEGRMDLTALAFALLAWWAIVLPNRQPLLHTWQFWVSSVAVACAWLTTPRVGVVLLPLFILAISRYKILIIIWLVIPFLSYGAWVVYAFGGLTQWLTYYQSKLAYTKIETPSWYVPPHEIPTIAVTLLVLLLCVLRRQMPDVPVLTYMAIVGSVGLFYLLVHDAGVYSILILPHYYWLLGSGLQKCISDSAKRVSKKSITN